MPETTSQINITEPSADLRPYLEFLRNAGFGAVFTPQALQRSGIPGTGNLWGNLPQTTQQPQTQVPQPITSPIIDVPYDVMPVAEMRMLAREASSPGTRWMAHSSRMAEGGLARSAAEIERSLADVLLGPGGSPLGGIYPGLEVSPPVRIPSQIGTGTRVPPTPQPPNVSPLPPVISTPPSGTLPVLNPNPTLVQPPPGMPGGQLPPAPRPAAPPSAPPAGVPSAPPSGSAPPMPPQIPQFVTQRPENFAGAAQASSQGYNPNQYADQSVAERLAQQMGGQLQYTNVSGPIGPPSQATLNFGGAAQLNAGLVNQYLEEKDPSTREQNLRMLRDEIKMLGGTATFAKGGTVRAQEGLFGSSPFDNKTRDGFGQPSRLNTSTATTTAAPSTTPPATPPTAPPAFGQAPPEMLQGVLNPYQRFPGQRALGMGANFGQMGTGGELQVSDPTRAALQGLQRLPSYFDQFGNVRADRVDGVATSNLGIANDVFDVAGNQALSAAQTAGSLFDRNDVRSSFQDTMNYLRQNPTAFQAGDITLGQLGAPQLDAPLGVAPSALTSFQMEGPMTVDATGARINPLAVMGEQITGLPDLRQIQMEGPMRVDTAGSMINPLSVTGQQITGIPNLTRFQMAGPREVQAGGIAPTAVERQQVRDIIASNQGMNVTGEGYGATAMNDPRRFIDTGVSTSYMSPYQKQVIDTQLQEARRAFDEQRQVRSAQAIRAGAFGGGRQAVSESIAERDLANQQQNIVAQGLQSAFENAQAQFERDRAAGMSAQARNQEAANQAAQFGASSRQQAALANQANAQQFGLANLQALLQTQQLGANLGQQAALANQQAALEAARSNQQAGLQSQLANQAAQQEANRQNLAASLGVQELGAGQQFAAAQAQAQMGQQASLANQQAALEAARANQQTGLQGQLANQAALQQTRQQNLAAALGIQELGANQQFTAAQARAQMGQQAQLANQQAMLEAARANQQTGLQAQLANQAAIQQARQQNLAAALGVQELGAQQSLAAQQMNQGAGLTAGQANLQAALATQQLGRQSGLSAAQANQQTRLAQNQALLDAAARADQLAQQATQSNVANRLAALGQQTQSSLAANQIGQSRADLQRLAQAMELQNLQALQQGGANIDARTQQVLDLGYQDFINQRNFPYQQLNFLTGLLANMPQSVNQEQVLFQRTNPLSQISGLATAGLGALQAGLQK